MNPPAYTADAPSTPLVPRRTIQDIRALILGNAYIIRPRRSRSGDAEDIELIVARHRGPQASAEEIRLEQHYAFLVTRKSMDIEIIVKGQPRDTIEEALDYMLERTEDIVQDMLLRHGKHIESLGCCVACTRAIKAAPSP